MTASSANLHASVQPAVSATYVLSAIDDACLNDGMADLTSYKGHQLTFRIKGVAELLRINLKSMSTLIGLGVIRRVANNNGRAWILEFDPGWGCLDVWERWIGRQPPPECLADFDKIRLVRKLLHLPLRTSYPQYVIDAAIDFLEGHEILNGRELLQLLPFRTAGDDPTQSALTARKRRRARLNEEGMTLLKFVETHLPANLRVIPMTILDPLRGGDLPAPPPIALHCIASVTHLKLPAAVYIFRLAASGVTEKYVAHMASWIANFEDSLAFDPDAGESIFVKAQEHIQQFLTEIEGAAVNPSKLSYIIAYTRMIADLRCASLEENASDAIRGLIDPGAVINAATDGALKAAVRRVDQASLRARMRHAGPLAERLDLVAAAIEWRWHDIENLLMKVRSAASSLSHSSEGVIRFTCNSTVEEDDGQPAGISRTDYWEVWSPDAYLSRLMATHNHLATMPARIQRHFKGKPRADNEPFYLRHVNSEIDGQLCDPPFFVEIFSYDLMNGSWQLPVEVRERRYAMIMQHELLGAASSPAGMLDFDDDAKEIHRTALLHGETLVPIENFALAMRVARAAFLCGKGCGMRAGELLQIRSNGSNIHFDPEEKIGYWTAQPKGGKFPLDNEAAASARRYYMDNITLEAVVELREELVKVFGESVILAPIKPAQQLISKLGSQPYLFRSASRALGSGDLHLFMSYLCLGYGSLSVHDLRAAVAKDLNCRGVAVEKVRDLLGHDDTSVTYRYMLLTDSLAKRKGKPKSRAESIRKSKRLALANAAHLQRR